jgi:hypothetical protein
MNREELERELEQLKQKLSPYMCVDCNLKGISIFSGKQLTLKQEVEYLRDLWKKKEKELKEIL